MKKMLLFVLLNAICYFCFASPKNAKGNYLTSTDTKKCAIEGQHLKVPITWYIVIFPLPCHLTATITTNYQLSVSQIDDLFTSLSDAYCGE